MLQAVDPSTGATVREVAIDTPEEIAAKLAAAREAFASWGRTDFAQRGELLRAVAARMRERRDELGLLMTEEMGKPVKEARGEVEKAAWCAEHYAEHAEAYLAEEVIASDATYSSVRSLPLGTVLGILPWNAPFWLAFRYCAPALMAGNTCLMKHDSHTPGCLQGIASVFEDVGTPAGVFQPLYVTSGAVADVIRDDTVRAVSFTGSSGGGAKVAALAAAEIKPAVLELGGSDPCVVLADADLDQAAEAATLSRIINAGQSCIAAKRIIVEAPVYDAMVERLRDRLGKLVLGDPRQETTDVGPIARADLREELHRQVQATVEQGGRCLLGGAIPDGPGFFYPVTLLADVTPEMTASCEETFGPVAVVLRAADEAEAIAMANDTPYGLAAAIWTEAERGKRLAAQFETGQVAVNGVVKTDPRLPSGGVKRSGYGRELGPHGIRAFVNHQQLWVGPKRA